MFQYNHIGFIYPGLVSNISAATSKDYMQIKLLFIYLLIEPLSWFLFVIHKYFCITTIISA